MSAGYPREAPMLPIAEKAVKPGMPAWLWLLELAAPFRALVALSAICGFLTAGSGIGLMAASAFIIASAALHPSIAVLEVAIVGVRFFGLARGIFRYLERYLSHQVTFRLLANLRVSFYRALEPLAPARLVGSRSGDLIGRVIGDISTLENFYVRAVAPVIVACLVALAVGLFMARFDGRLALILLVFMLLAGLVMPLLMRRISRSAGKKLILGRAGLNSTLLDGIQGLPELVAFGQGESQLERIRQVGAGIQNAQNDMANLLGLQNMAGVLLSNLAVLAVLIFGILLVRSGELPGVYLPVIVLVALASFEAILPLSGAAQYLESNLAAARRLLEIAGGKPEVRIPEEPLPLPAHPVLEARSLCFQYPEPGNFQGTLDRISFELKPDKRLAVVGPAGAGKTTLVNLLLRFWEYDREPVPHPGSEKPGITLDGVELSRFDPYQVRALFGVVSQHTYLFHATVRDNLLAGSPGATEEQLIDAAGKAQIHDFILSLPQGYDTWVGEQGLKLSAGERQRLAIARALLKNAPFLILDEATANLDAVTERQVLGSLHMLMEGRGTLMITHRLAAMPWMDEILVLDQGRIVQRGKHPDLLAGEGLYRQMWESQNRI
ncbi:MAG: thiol reductant ABC exporter subunit CydC [Omnitrophica WOR_2 bacterium]